MKCLANHSFAYFGFYLNVFKTNLTMMGLVENKSVRIPTMGHICKSESPPWVMFVSQNPTMGHVCMSESNTMGHVCMSESSSWVMFVSQNPHHGSCLYVRIPTMGHVCMSESSSFPNVHTFIAKFNVRIPQGQYYLIWQCQNPGM